MAKQDERYTDDHDTLVELATSFKGFVVRYDQDMKDLKDGTNSRLADMEARMRVVERVHEKVDPEQSKKDLEKLKQELEDFRRYWKMAQILVSSITFGIGFLLAVVTQVKNLFGK